jgi:hypothetical protein
MKMGRGKVTRHKHKIVLYGGSGHLRGKRVMVGEALCEFRVVFLCPRTILTKKKYGFFDFQ